MASSSTSEQNTPVVHGGAGNRALASAGSAGGVERRSYGEVNYVPAPDKPRLGPLIAAGLAVGGVFFGGFGSWAALAPISSAAVTPGVLVVESKVKKIQHFEGGIIEDLLVKDGQEVQEGQVLIRIVPEQSEFRLDALDEEIVASLANEARLKAHLADAAKVEYPQELERRRNETMVASVLAAQDALFATTEANAREQIDLLDQKSEQFKAQIVGFAQQVTASDKQLALSREELADNQELLKEGLARKSSVLALQRSISEIESRRGQAIAAIAQAREGINGTEIQRSLVRKQLHEMSGRELSETRSKLSELRANQRQAQGTLTRTEIRAPITGRVANLQFVTVGGVIRSSEPIMDIVPSNAPLLIEAHLDPLDRDVVHVGLPAEIQLTAFKQRSTPTVPGKVVDISADLVHTAQNLPPYYKMTVTMDQEESKKFPLYQGMPAEVMVKIEDRTLLDYLLGPLIDSFNRSFRDQ